MKKIIRDNSNMGQHQAQSEVDTIAAQVPAFLTNQWAGASPYGVRSEPSTRSVSPTHFASHSDPFPLYSNRRDIAWGDALGSMVQGRVSKKRIRRDFGRWGRNTRQ